MKFILNEKLKTQAGLIMEAARFILATEEVDSPPEDKDGCPNCHHQVSLWLGFSGVDNDGVHLAYRCPQCGFETCDYLPSVDDVVPNTIAWRREPDGVITWYPEVRAEQSVQSDVMPCAECGGAFLHKEGCSQELSFYETAHH